MVLNLHLQILKPLLSSENYNKYSNYLNLDFLDKNYPDIARLYKCLPTLHKEAKDYSIDDLKVALFTAYPKADEQQYNRLFEELKDTEVDSTLLVEYLKQAASREKALQIARLAIQASEGVISFDEVSDRIASLEDDSSGPEDWRENIVSTDIRKLYGDEAQTGGLRWRLGSLNRALGPLRTGNFGFVFARPETGKTSFLSSELTFMAENLEEDKGPIVWFNNEQAGFEVQKYIVRAALGLPDKGVEGDIDKYNEQFNAKVGGKLLLIDNIFYKKDMERIVKELKPSLIVIDQIDNVKGFKADRPDLEFKEIYQWAREMAKTYCPVIGICQAGATGEDKKWLTMNDVDSSKTTKQGAADWILGIGKIHEQGFEQVRFLHLSKNKLSGDKYTDSRERHGKWQVLIKPEISSYADF